MVNTHSTTKEAVSMPNITDKNGMKVLDPINIAKNFNDYFLTIAKISKNIKKYPKKSKFSPQLLE